jgi:hypothetical protein
VAERDVFLDEFAEHAVSPMPPGSNVDLFARPRMHVFIARLAAFAAIVSLPLSLTAQQGSRPPEPEPNAATFLGLTISSSGTDRDTLGAWVSEVVPGSPADRARIQQGDRIAELNGMSLRISPEDVGRREAEDLVARRFAREVARIRAGADVTARIYADGEFRAVTIETRRVTARPVTPRRAPPVDDVEIEPRRPASPPSQTLDDIIASLGETERSLRLVIDAESNRLTRDSLAQALQELVMLRRRMREWQVELREPTRDRRDEDRADALPGLRVTVVSEELASYFGDESAGGLLVLEASDAWDPIRAGDVIVRIDDEPATQEALRTARDSRRSVSVELLRRKRLVLVTLRPER